MGKHAFHCSWEHPNVFKCTKHRMMGVVKWWTVWFVWISCWANFSESPFRISMEIGCIPPGRLKIGSVDCILGQGYQHRKYFSGLNNILEREASSGEIIVSKLAHCMKFRCKRWLYEALSADLHTLFGVAQLQMTQISILGFHVSSHECIPNGGLLVMNPMHGTLR